MAVQDAVILRSLQVIFFLLCWRTAGVVCPTRAGDFLFLYFARALTWFSPFMGE